MKLKNIFSILAILLHISCSTLYEKRPSWRDEFRKNGTPNKEIWTRSVTMPGQQLSVYCDNDSNVYVKDGMLHLRLFKSDDITRPYRSGRVIANKKYWFKKGKLEVRAKAPLAKGVWPAIWLNGPKTKNGYFVEIDLMEHVHAMGASRYEASYHIWGEFRGKKGNHISYGEYAEVNVGEWHVYTLEISDDNIVMKVDNKVIYDIKRGKYGEEWPDDQEYSLRLALAYGGYGARKHGLDDSALPVVMLIDYVRFYKFKKNKYANISK